MKLQTRETVAMRGYFLMRVYRRGVLIEEYEDRNLIVDGARVLVTRLITGVGNGIHINRISFGTNGNIPVPGDTAVTSPFTKGFDRVSYPSGNQAEFHWSLAATEANGKAIREFGLICTDNSLFSRKSRTNPIYKDSDIAIEGQWIITN